MKISKATQWALTIGIFAILLISAGVFYGRQQAEQRGLNSAIAQANKSLTNYSAQKKDLETRRTQANSRIASIQDEFSQYTQSIEINEAVFQTAKDAGVTVTAISLPPPTAETRNGISYRVFSLSVTAEGEVLPELLIFSKKITEKFSSVALKSVNIGGGGGEQKPNIVLALKIYTYEK